MVQPKPYTPSRSLPAKLARRLVQWRRAAPATVEAERPIVSFTFDDFPKSAVNGADIIEKAGGRAGFYASTAFLGATHPQLGEMFDADTLAGLHARGHEIGAHTHNHIDCARTRLRSIEQDVGENLVYLVRAGHVPTVASFAYPYGETTYATKRWSAHVFSTSRGVLPGVNVGEVDRAQLFAVELGESARSRKRAVTMLEACVQARGWLIFFTHDVAASPTSYGVSTAQLEELAKRAIDLGCVLAPPTEAAHLAKVLN